MATSDTKGQLTGSIGPIYYRKLNGKLIAQTKPGKRRVKQAPSTKSSASEFGTASGTARKIRSGLAEILRDMSDTMMSGRFTAKLYEASVHNNEAAKGTRSLIGGSPSILNGFNFNMHSPFENYSSLVPAIAGNNGSSVSISISAVASNEALLFPPGATDAELCMLVAAFNPADWERSHAEVFKLALPRRNALIESQEWISAEIPEGHLVIIVSAVIFYGQDRLMGRLSLNNRNLHPCQLAASFMNQQPG